MPKHYSITACTLGIPQVSATEGGSVHDGKGLEGSTEEYASINITETVEELVMPVYIVSV